MELAFPLRDTPDVKVLHRDVEIAAEKHVAFRRAIIVKEPPKPLKPIELEGELVGPKLGAVRDIGIDDADAIDGPRDQALWRFPVVIGKPFYDVRDLVLRENGDAVVRLLAKELDLVARLGDRGKREILVNALRLLKANNIRPGPLKPVKQMLHPRVYRIHIPGRDLHFITFTTENTKNTEIGLIVSYRELPSQKMPSVRPWIEVSVSAQSELPEVSQRVSMGHITDCAFY